MPILIRYCFVQLVPPFLLSVFVTTFVLNLLFYLLEFIDFLLVKQVGAANSLMLLLYVQPSLLVLALPIGFLAALLIVFGRLSADREMMAMESMGFSPGLLLWPVVLFGGLYSVVLVFFMNWCLPWGNTSYVKLYYRIVSERSAVAITERVFIRDFEGYILYVDRKDEKADVLRNVMVQFLDEKGGVQRVVMAPEGRIRRDAQNLHVLLELKGGILQQTGDGSPPAPGAAPPADPASKLLNMRFDDCVLDLDIRRAKPGLMDFRGPRNMTLAELSRELEAARAAGRDTREMEAEYHKKFSIPFSALAFALIGVPLGLLTRSGSFLGIFMAVVLVTFYWLLTILAETLVAKGTISGFIAWWSPNFLLMAIGLFLAWLLYIKKIRLLFLEGFRRRTAASAGAPSAGGRDGL
jgi:LPS export ABC transporter permease LptF